MSSINDFQPPRQPLESPGLLRQLLAHPLRGGTEGLSFCILIWSHSVLNWFREKVRVLLRESCFFIPASHRDCFFLCPTCLCRHQCWRDGQGERGVDRGLTVTWMPPPPACHYSIWASVRPGWSTNGPQPLVRRSQVLMVRKCIHPAVPLFPFSQLCPVWALWPHLGKAGPSCGTHCVSVWCTFSA